MGLHVFGIRHHGPGCARSLRMALDQLRPSLIVMEGPADAEDALPLAAHGEMRPPVALLVYAPDEPRRAVHYPLAEFSPEWQTLRWAAEQGVPVRLMDLPQAHQLALDRADELAAAEKEAEEKAAEEKAAEDKSAETGAPARRPAAVDRGESEEAGDLDPRRMGDRHSWRTDPLALLAEAAGYTDHELWWEENVERRSDATGLFAAILEAMRTVRDEFPERRDRDLLREAHMRRTLRSVLKERHENVAVVCGAWHAPVLDEAAVTGKTAGCRAADDNRRLKGLPKLKTATTWIPWTHSRLTYRSGYGAGVHSPGWYHHLWKAPEEAATRWITTAARLLRERDLDASSASIIEARRLADALSAMRHLRSPGLEELNESILAVLCHGESAPMQLIRQRLEIGSELGEVPDETPAVPLARDLGRLQKSLRLKPTAEARLIDLDVRKGNDLARSHLLHQLGLLGISWGQLQRSGGRVSTFHEVWQVEWKPEYSVAVIESSMWGSTVEAAATAKVRHRAAEQDDLAAVTELLDAAMLAGLQSAVDPLLSRIQAMAAVGADVRHLLEALLPLARVARYGDVRGTRSDHVQPILSGMFERACVGLPAACTALDDEAAERMLTGLRRATEALEVFDRTDLQAEWRQELRRLMDRDVHPLLGGWCCRLLLDQRALEPEELHRRARLALSPAGAPSRCAAWATGLLRGSGLLLLHQEGLWAVFDRWLRELPSETFTEMLPLLRRAFAEFTGPERRQMGEKVRRLGSDDANGRRPARAEERAEVDAARAEKVLPVLAHILGGS